MNDAMTPKGSRPSSATLPVVTPTTTFVDFVAARHRSSANTTAIPPAGVPDFVEVVVSLPKFINLNVGGVKFTTSRDSLCRFEGSYLEAMFSGRHSMEELKMEDGSYFIDRDGK